MSIARALVRVRALVLVRAFLLVGAVLLEAQRSVAQTASRPPVYDLWKCIDRSVERSADLGAAAAGIAVAEARLREAKAVRFGQDEYRQVVGVVSRARGDPVFSPDSKNDLFEGLGPFTRLDLAINIPLYTFGKLSSAIEAAEHGIEAEQASSETKRAEIVLSTKRLYYGLVFTRQLSLVLHDMLDTLDKAIKRTEERLASSESPAERPERLNEPSRERSETASQALGEASGELEAVSEPDLLRLKIGRAKLAKGVFDVDAAAAIARTALAHAIGREEQDFEIVDRKLAPAEVDLEPVEVYLAEARAHGPERRALAAGVAAQMEKLKIEKAAYFPALVLSTGVQLARAPNRDEQENPFAYDELNFIRPLVVLVLSWNLNFLTTSAKVGQASAELERLEARQRQAAAGLDLEARRSYFELTKARGTMRAAEEGSKAGRGLLILTVSNFDLGLVEGDELMRSVSSYIESQADYLRAIHDYNIALAELSKAVGREVLARPSS